MQLQQSLQQHQAVNPVREDPPSDDIILPTQEVEFETLEAAQLAAERYARSVNTVVIVKRTTKDKYGNVVQVSGGHAPLNRSCSEGPGTPTQETDQHAARNINRKT